MEENPTASQVELLSKIHNHLVDLKTIVVEIALSDPNASQTLQTQLQQIISNDQHVDTEGRSGVQASRERKTIAPTDGDIEPGQDRPTGEHYR